MQYGAPRTEKDPNADAFKAGDVVALKCGSPSMVVVKVEENGNIECKWICPEHTVKAHFFPPESLAKAEKKDDKPKQPTQ